MSIAGIFTDFFKTSGGLQVVARWAHILAGITWIGLLYFFNFVQTPAYAELSPGARNEAFDKITWRALWWFRWAAMATFAFGLLMLAIYSSDSGKNGAPNYASPTHFQGASILTGVLFGVTMLANVWLVIWPAQQTVIGSVRRQLGGGEADPAQPAAAKKGARASRANTFFSITMLWFMVFTSHGVGLGFGDKLNNPAIYWILVLVLWAFVEGSALGLLGGLDSAWNKLAFDDHRKTILFGFVYWVVIYFVGWELILKP